MVALNNEQLPKQVIFLGPCRVAGDKPGMGRIGRTGTSANNWHQRLANDIQAVKANEVPTENCPSMLGSEITARVLLRETRSNESRGRVQGRGGRLKYSPERNKNSRGMVSPGLTQPTQLHSKVGTERNYTTVVAYGGR